MEEEKNSLTVQLIINKLFHEKAKLMPFLKIEGFRQKLETALSYLRFIANGSYEGQEHVDYLYSIINDEYLAVNYYTEMNVDDYNELNVGSYTIETLFWDFKNNQMHIFERFHTNGDRVYDEKEDIYFNAANTWKTMYSLTKYWIEDNAPKHLNKSWTFNYENYEEMTNNEVVDLINQVSGDLRCNMDKYFTKDRLDQYSRILSSN